MLLQKNLITIKKRKRKRKSSGGRNAERPQKTTSMLAVTRANGELKSAYPIPEP